MCELVTHVVHRDSTATLSTEQIHRVPSDDVHRMGPPDDPRIVEFCVLECRHPGTGWQEVPWPTAGQALLLPADTEVRIVGRSARKARAWDRLCAREAS